MPQITPVMDPLRNDPILRDLSEINNWKAVGAIVFEWGAIFLAVLISEKFWNPLLYFFVIIWIGSRLHAMGILMHDATHYRLLKNKKWNDIVGEVFLAWPLTLTADGFRKRHLAHHAYLETDKDVDWVASQSLFRYQFPRKPWEFAGILFKYAVGYYGIKEIFEFQKLTTQTPLSIKICRYFYYGTLLAASLYFGFFWKLILYWAVPLLTWVLLFFYIRDVAEHYAGLRYEHVYNQTRTSILSWWEALLFVPYNAHYHIEHHLYTSVPFYNLKKLHKRLMKDPVYVAKAHITRGYLRGLFNEICAT